VKIRSKFGNRNSIRRGDRAFRSWSETVIVASPDGKVKAELSTADGVLQYRVLVDGKQVLAPSKVGIEADDVEYGRDATLGAAKLRKVDEHYHFNGAHAEAVNRANEATVPAKSHGGIVLRRCSCRE